MLEAYRIFGGNARAILHVSNIWDAQQRLKVCFLPNQPAFVCLHAGILKPLRFSNQKGQAAVPCTSL